MASIRYGFFFTLFILSGAFTQASAAPRCEGLFTIPLTQASRDWKSQVELQHFNQFKLKLNKQALAKAGYYLKNDVLIQASNNQELGKLKVLETKYLFQWADKDYHQTILERPGIDAEWMSEILHEPGQVAGKGFYVSSDPFDSISYGTHLTVFSTPKPMIILEGNSLRLTQHIFNSTKNTEQLAAIGIDAVRSENYHSTWFAFIHPRSLLKVENSLPVDLVRGRFSNIDISRSTRPGKIDPPQLQKLLVLLKEIDPTDIYLEMLIKIARSPFSKPDVYTVQKILQNASENVTLLTLSVVSEQAKYSPDLAQAILPYLASQARQEKVAETLFLAQLWNQLRPEQKQQIPMTDILATQLLFRANSISGYPFEVDATRIAKTIPAHQMGLFISHLKTFKTLPEKANLSAVLNLVTERIQKANNPTEMTGLLKAVYNNANLDWPVKDSLFDLHISGQKMSASQRQKLRYQVMGDLFGLTEISTIQAKDKSRLIEMESITDQFLQEITKIDLANIDNLQSLSIAAEQLFSIKPEIRTKDANVDINPVYPEQFYDVIRVHSVLNVNQNAGGSRKYSYWNLGNIDRPTDTLLPYEYRNQLKAQLAANPHSKALKTKIYNESLTKITEQFLKFSFDQAASEQLHIKSSSLPEEHLSILRSVQPFESNNQLMSRLIYMILKERQTGTKKRLNYLMPSWDSHVAVGAANGHQKVNLYLSDWISNASNTKEFISRSKWSKYILEQTLPQYLALGDTRDL